MENEPIDAWATSPAEPPADEPGAGRVIVPPPGAMLAPGSPVPEGEVATTAAVSPRRGHPRIAWAVIAGVVAFVIAMASLGDLRERKAASANRLEDRSVEMQAKYLVGAAEFMPQQKSQLAGQVDSLDQGSFARRLRVVVLSGELESPKRALERLESLEKAKPAEGEDTKLADVLRALYGDYERGQWAAPSVSATDRDRLRALGWCGELALAPRGADASAARAALIGQARRTFIASISLLLLGAAVSFFGMVGIGGFVVGVVTGSLRPRQLADLLNGDFYLETFAVWLTTFILLSLVPAFLPKSVPQLGVMAVLSLAALVAASWPCWRGVPWREVRQEIGLHLGRPWLEIACGFAGYVSLIPLLLIATAVMAGILAAARAVGWMSEDQGFTQATHPIVEFVLRGSLLDRVLVFLVAAVIAPLTEEIMFRGFLYRYLRTRTAKWRLASSVAVSAVVSSLIFAAIHPQGWIGIPMLSTLAIGFCLLREWRGSLLAPITAHALNNGVIMFVTLLWA